MQLKLLSILCGFYFSQYSLAQDNENFLYFADSQYKKGHFIVELAQAPERIYTVILNILNNGKDIEVFDVSEKR